LIVIEEWRRKHNNRNIDFHAILLLADAAAIAQIHSLTASMGLCHENLLQAPIEIILLALFSFSKCSLFTLY
jgi:hypothetical protein